MLTEEKRNISKVLSPGFEPEIKKKKKTGKNKTILWASLTYPWKPIHYEEKGGKQPPDSLYLWKNHCINN